MRRLLLLLHASTYAWQPQSGSLRRSAVSRATAPCASADPCGPLRRVVHRVGDQEAVGRFYESCVGLEALPCPPGNKECMVVGASEDALCLELVSGSASTGYAMLCARVPSVDEAVERVRKWCADTDDAAAVQKEPATIEHTASLIPDQPEEEFNPVKQATVCDPSGASVVLWEAGGEAGGGAATLTGVRLEVYEWKKSQTWYEQSLGWATLRHQSNVPLEAGLTITVGEKAAGGEAPSVWGAEAAEAKGGVVMVHYGYGTKKAKCPDGLVSLVVDRPGMGPGMSHELADPDGYPVLLTAAEGAGAVSSWFDAGVRLS